MPSLVVEQDDVTDVKTTIKRLPFGIRRLSKTKGQFLLSEQFIIAAKNTARFYGGKTGQVISQFTPSFIWRKGFKNTPRRFEHHFLGKRGFTGGACQKIANICQG